MKLTSKGNYALRGMLDLYAHSNGSPVRLQEISERQDISISYLEQIFRKLRKAGIVQSVKGPGGGYLAEIPAKELTVADVMQSVGESSRFSVMKDGKSSEAKKIYQFFNVLNEEIQEFLKAPLSELMGE